MSKSKSKIEEIETDPVCYYCKEHRVDPLNKLMFNGYLDKDLNRVVCWPCSRNHYVEKAKTEFAGMHTEFPLYAKARNYGNTGRRQSKSEHN